ncbi:MAG: hypothetical protein ACAI25_04075 [Planctomycetota bacterium]
MLLKALGSCVLLAAALVVPALGGREASRAEPRWTSSFAPTDAGFSIDLPVRERRWMRATELQAGFEGFNTRDVEKRALHAVVFGQPERPWTVKDARAYLERIAAVETGARIERTSHQGRPGFELVSSSAERTLRYRVFLDGGRVVIVSALSTAEDADTARFFSSLEFATRTVVAGAVASRR